MERVKTISVAFGASELELRLRANDKELCTHYTLHRKAARARAETCSAARA